MPQVDCDTFGIPTSALVNIESGKSPEKEVSVHRPFSEGQGRPFLRADPRRGFILFFVLSLGIFLLFLGIGLFFFSGQQNALAHAQRFGEMARFLAESGVEITRETFRRKLQQGAIGGDEALRQWLLSPSIPADLALNRLLVDPLQPVFDSCAANLDRTASLEVRCRLSSARQTETDPLRWADVRAKEAWFYIEAVARCRGAQALLTTRYRLSVANCLPPVFSKFTLHFSNTSPDGGGTFNIVRNDDRGQISSGPRPIVFFNHNTPENPVEPQALQAVFAEESSPQVFQKRGWIYLGGQGTRLNLAAGGGNLGEGFFFGNTDSGSGPTFGRYELDRSQLPPALLQPIRTYWDLLEVDPMREISYRVSHEFRLEGFFDKAGNKPTEAMFANGILSERERITFGSRSSLIHLCGDSRPGFRSRTRVLGRITAAFSKISNLVVDPEEREIKERFKEQDPPPRFLVPSMSESDFDSSARITDFLNRRFGGPTLSIENLAQNYDVFKPLGSGIQEVPYAHLYNCAQEASSGKNPLAFPPPMAILGEDDGNHVEMNADNRPIYEGAASPRAFLEVVHGRVQFETMTIAGFWRRFFDPGANTLNLKRIVRIRNPERATLILPPPGTTSPLEVVGGGMIILDQGNLVLRGVRVHAPVEALTVVLPTGGDVSFENSLPNQVNIVAPASQLHAAAPFSLCGTLAIGGISTSDSFPGGSVFFRESQDPTGTGYGRYYVIDLSESDSSWHG